MGHSKHVKFQRSLTRSKKSQKKYTRKTICTKSCSHRVPVHLDSLEDINESVRVYRAQRASLKGNWKVVPKDSCEIYRERMRRKISNERRSRKQDGSDKNAEGYVEDERRRNGKKKTRKKSNQRRNKNNQKRSKRKPSRPRSALPYSSHTSTLVTSCSSFSDMDLD